MGFATAIADRRSLEFLAPCVAWSLAHRCRDLLNTHREKEFHANYTRKRRA